MTWQAFAASASDWVAGVTFFVAIGFIIGYSALAGWWRHPVGWTIVLLDSVIAILLLPGMLNLLLGINVEGSEAWTFTSLVTFAAVPVIITWRFLILVRAQWRNRNDPPPELPGRR